MFKSYEYYYNNIIDIYPTVLFNEDIYINLIFKYKNKPNIIIDDYLNINCYNCDKCALCENCNSCKLSLGCNNCKFCNDCYYCNNCVSCKNYCIKCIDLLNCNSCSQCISCRYCNNCTKCENCSFKTKISNTIHGFKKIN